MYKSNEGENDPCTTIEPKPELRHFLIFFLLLVFSLLILTENICCNSHWKSLMQWPTRYAFMMYYTGLDKANFLA